MKIFAWIRGYFDKVRSHFRKKKQEQEVRDRIVKMQGISREEIQTSIKEKVSQENPLTTSEILELAETQTATELQKLIVPTVKIRNFFFDLVGIEQDVTALNKKLIEIQIKQKEIEPVYFPKNYKTDNDIEELKRILQKHDNKQNLIISTSAIDKLKSRFGSFGKFLQDVLVRQYQFREAERAKNIKLEIEALHIQVINQIKQDDFQSAKLTFRTLEELLKPEQALSIKIVEGKAKGNNRIDSNLISKTAKLKRELSFRETEIEAKRQAEELKKQQEEVERRKLAEEERREEERQRREQAERQLEETKRQKEDDKKQVLQRLLVKKTNSQDFAKVLQANKITTLYHFTDRANIHCIKQQGGLFSWHYLRKVGIEVPYEGGGSLSKDLDRRYGFEDFVRVCFTKNHPMMYIALRDGRIPNPVILEINTEVCELQNTKFSNMNATKNGHNCGNDLADLQRIEFEIVKQENQFDLSEQEKPYYQAEILVKTWIPIEYITNINQF